jgi:hypothetical protein
MSLMSVDLAWVDGESLLIHGPKNVSGDNPTLETYFFSKVKPLIEKALKEGNKGNCLVPLELHLRAELQFAKRRVEGFVQCLMN